MGRQSLFTLKHSMFSFLSDLSILQFTYLLSPLALLSKEPAFKSTLRPNVNQQKKASVA